MERSHIRDVDPDAADALSSERQRQEDTLAMIASENHVSEAVLEAQGSALTNKYAEGYPGERYYAGCEYADEIESLAIERAEELWGAEHVNVQPHSGTQANMAVYLTALDPGDKILSLDLTHGGHLSHGHPANFTGQTYTVEQYEVDPETGYIDYEGLKTKADEFADDIDNSVFPGAQGGPLMHNVAGKAVGFKEALSDEFEAYAEQTVKNAEELANTLTDAGLSVVSGGTDNHLVLVDLRPSHPETTGKEVEAALESAGIIMNANTVPGETRSAFNPSGIRVGTPALTTRGFTESTVREVGELMIELIDDPTDDEAIAAVSDRVDTLTDEYPLYR